MHLKVFERPAKRADYLQVKTALVDSDVEKSFSHEAFELTNELPRNVAGKIDSGALKARVTSMEPGAADE